MSKRRSHLGNIQIRCSLITNCFQLWRNLEDHLKTNLKIKRNEETFQAGLMKSNLQMTHHLHMEPNLIINYDAFNQQKECLHIHKSSNLMDQKEGNLMNLEGLKIKLQYQLQINQIELLQRQKSQVKKTDSHLLRNFIEIDKTSILTKNIILLILKRS